VVIEARCADRDDLFEGAVDEICDSPFGHGNQLDWKFYIVADNGDEGGTGRCGVSGSHTRVVLFLGSFSSHFTLNVLVEVSKLTWR